MRKKNLALILALSLAPISFCQTAKPIENKPDYSRRITSCDGLPDDEFVDCANGIITRLDIIEGAKGSLKLIDEKPEGKPGWLCRNDWMRRTYNFCLYDLCREVTPPPYYDPSFCTVWGERAGLVGGTMFLMWLNGQAAHK